MNRYRITSSARTSLPQNTVPAAAARIEAVIPERERAAREAVLLSVEEVTLLLQAAPGPKYQAAFATAYGAGLRVSEVVALKRVHQALPAPRSAEGLPSHPPTLYIFQ
jgi:integrase